MSNAQVNNYIALNTLFTAIIEIKESAARFRRTSKQIAEVDMSFIFQSKPILYDLRKRLIPGQRVAWIASRYREFMILGEVVYLWLAGEPAVRGIYGWGEITGDRPEPDRDGSFRVEVTYRRAFLEHPSEQHLTVDEIRSDEVLASLLILRSPTGTNFLLTQAEDQALRRLIKSKYGEEWLPPKNVAWGGTDV
jgi:hypothetical protein